MKWISVSDKSPPHKTRVLAVYDGEIDILEYVDWLGADVWLENGWQEIENVTHWMALPEVPE